MRATVRHFPQITTNCQAARQVSRACRQPEPTCNRRHDFVDVCAHHRGEKSRVAWLERSWRMQDAEVHACLQMSQSTHDPGHLHWCGSVSSSARVRLHTLVRSAISCLKQGDAIREATCHGQIRQRPGHSFYKETNKWNWKYLCIAASSLLRLDVSSVARRSCSGGRVCAADGIPQNRQWMKCRSFSTRSSSPCDLRHQGMCMIEVSRLGTTWAASAQRDDHVHPIQSAANELPGICGQCSYTCGCIYTGTLHRGVCQWTQDVQ